MYSSPLRGGDCVPVGRSLVPAVTLAAREDREVLASTACRRDRHRIAVALAVGRQQIASSGHGRHEETARRGRCGELAAARAGRWRQAAPEVSGVGLERGHTGEAVAGR